MKREFLSTFKYALINVLRVKWLLPYALLFAIFGGALLKFTSDPDKAGAGLLNVVLLIVPMVSAIYSAIYWYDSDLFVHLLLTQPVRRRSALLSIWLAVSTGMAGSFFIGLLIPLAAFAALSASSLLLLLDGILLTFIFSALGTLISVLNSQRMKGIGFTVIIWLYFAVLHDALVFTMMSTLKDYPIEMPSLFLMILNPIDLARVSLLLSMDLSAMMGYTGKILQQLLSSSQGILLTTGSLLLWVIFPVAIALNSFHKRDL